jgi:predicted nucleotidyltransferase
VKLQRDLREFVESLNDHGVEFLIVGGYAVAFHGYPRFTGDIDLFIRPSNDNARRVINVLDAFGFGSAGVTEADLTTPGKVVQLGAPPSRIDLLSSVKSLTFEHAWAERVPATLDGLGVAFVSKAHLIRNRAALSRPKDVADVAKLRDISGDGEAET